MLANLSEVHVRLYAETMKFSKQRPFAHLFLFISCLALSNHAWSLAIGYPVARATVGQSLIFVTALKSDNSTLNEGCFKADVFYGSRQIRKDRVHITVEGKRPVFALKLTVDEAQREPVAVVNLKAGCGYNLTRKFTIFALTIDRLVPDGTSVGAHYGNQRPKFQQPTIRASTRPAAKPSHQSAGQSRTLAEVCQGDLSRTIGEVCSASANLAVVK